MMRPVVLVHGAFHRGSCWDAVASGLRANGVVTVAPDLPFTGYADDLSALEAVVDSLPGNEGVVVCGHSGAGHLVSDLRSGRAERFVFLASFMPLEGDEPLPVIQSAPPTALSMELGDDGTCAVLPEVAGEAFYSECSGPEAAAATLGLRPMAMSSLFAPPASTPSWLGADSTYVVCSQDRAFHPDLQRHLAQRATRVESLDTGHAAFLTTPVQLTEILMRCATAERGSPSGGDSVPDEGRH